MAGASAKMNDNIENLQKLTLYILLKRLPVEYLLEKGYSSGQIMRSLVKARENGFLQVNDGVSVITDAGKRILQEWRHDENRGPWIRGQDEEKREPIALSEIFFPKKHERLLR